MKLSSLVAGLFAAVAFAQEGEEPLPTGVGVRKHLPSLLKGHGGPFGSSVKQHQFPSSVNEQGYNEQGYSGQGGAKQHQMPAQTIAKAHQEFPDRSSVKKHQLPSTVNEQGYSEQQGGVKQHQMPGQTVAKAHQQLPSGVKKHQLPSSVNEQGGAKQHQVPAQTIAKAHQELPGGSSVKKHQFPENSSVKKQRKGKKAVQKHQEGGQGLPHETGLKKHQEGRGLSRRATGLKAHQEGRGLSRKQTGVKGHQELPPSGTDDSSEDAVKHALNPNALILEDAEAKNNNPAKKRHMDGVYVLFATIAVLLLLAAYRVGTHCANKKNLKPEYRPLLKQEQGIETIVLEA